MKISSILSIGISALALAACGGAASGNIVLGLKDGPPTSSDGRTITSLEVDVTKIALHADGTDTQQARNEDKDVVVFDAGTGAAHTVDLLKVTTFSEIMANVSVPAGSYEGAEVVVSGARVFFADAPAVAVPLTLEGDGNSASEFDFHFKPNHVVVSDSGTTLAVLDFVPMVKADGAGAYKLDHDGENDDSGERDEHQSEIEVKGAIATIAGNSLTLAGGSMAAVDISNAQIELNGAPATKAQLSIGLKIEAEGTLDAATGALVATKIKIED